MENPMPVFPMSGWTYQQIVSAVTWDVLYSNRLRTLPEIEVPKLEEAAASKGA